MEPSTSVATDSMAVSRPCGVPRSAEISAPSRSIPITLHPSERSRAAVAAPIPLADPVMTAVRFELMA